MVEQREGINDDARGEAGTTLAELLVVIVLMGIVGTVTTAGIVAGFRAQLDASNVAETLDGMRLATQRVRDFTREADEVCTSSTPKSLVLWTDDNADGVVEDSEKDIFELNDSVTPPVFQRSVPGSGEVQIIRDDILADAIFQYDYDRDADDDRDATDQPTDLACQDGPGVTGNEETPPIRSVKVTLTVDHPDPAGEDLTTSTTVRLRNADLRAAPNNEPVADFSFSCPQGSQTCSFDASASHDPNGTIASYTWDFGDGGTGSGVTTSHLFVDGDVDHDVVLLVVDNEGATNKVTATVRPGLVTGNARPVADFTYSCSGTECHFDGSASTDDGSISSWTWNFGDGTALVTNPTATASHSFASDDSYTVTLAVTDDGGKVSDPLATKRVVASESAMRVDSLGATVDNNIDGYNVTFAIEISLTKGIPPGDGIVVSVRLGGGRTGTDSCATDSTGRCSIEVKSVDPGATQSLRVTTLTDHSGTYTHDADQDKVDEIEVDKDGNETRYKGGTELP